VASASLASLTPAEAAYDYIGWRSQEVKEIFRKAAMLGMYVMNAGKTTVMELIRVASQAQRFKANWLEGLQVFSFELHPAETRRVSCRSDSGAE
jgi:hypothetical protein